VTKELFVLEKCFINFQDGCYGGDVGYCKIVYDFEIVKCIM